MTIHEALAQAGALAPLGFALAVYATGCALQQLFWPVRRQEVKR